MNNKKAQYIKTTVIAVLFALLSACGSTSQNNAEEVAVTNMGEVDATIVQDNNGIVEATATVSSRFNSSLDADEREEAEKEAFKSIIRSFIKQKYGYLSNNYEDNKAKINANIKDYILSSVITNEDINNDAKIYRISVRAEIDDRKLLRDISPPQNRQTRTSMTFVFVTRENVEYQLPDASRTRNEKPTYRYLDDESISGTMRAVLIDQRMFPQDAGTLSRRTGGVFNPTQFRKDYENGDRIADKTISSAVQGLATLEKPVDFLAIGSLTVDRAFKDPVTGLEKVAVVVLGRVLDNRENGADVAASEPAIYYGEGTTLLVAKTNAIRAAARETARILAGQIRSYESY